MFRLFLGLLVVLLVGLQYKLLMTSDGLPGVRNLGQQLQSQQAENEQLQQRNDKLAAEIGDLKQGLDAIEERARLDMGMIKEGEQFYHLIEPKTSQPRSSGMTSPSP